MTNDASRSGYPSRRCGSSCNDWESAALERVAARRIELQNARGDESAVATSLDWEQRAIECLRRYFRSQR
ncbi:MAG TPA: hypothetical protein VLB75_09630 [Steroidobacteraceae bacterium]|nr:hypothetical protein [Steroidobacteraceae bacterium]